MGATRANPLARYTQRVVVVVVARMPFYEIRAVEEPLTIPFNGTHSPGREENPIGVEAAPRGRRWSRRR